MIVDVAQSWRGLATRTVIGISLSAFLAAAAQAAPPSGPRTAGRQAGLWTWTIPNTPNGLRPLQGWSGAASAPNGDIYAAGMDHVTNSALYRLPPTGSSAALPGASLVYAGDARAASEAADNWQRNEGVEKFHTQPVWLGTRMFVGNLNYSLLDAEYLNRRGFHWYAYDWAAGSFADLSAGQPGGTGAPAGGLMALVADRARNLVYGVSAPTGDLYKYDPADGSSTKIGRPAYARAYVYPGRAMWLGSTGRLYFTAGNDNGSKTGAPYNPAIFNHVHYWDPATGFGQETGWGLRNQRAIDGAQCFGNPRTCYLMDNVGHIYRYKENAGVPSWTLLGDLGQQNDAKYGLTWVFHVSADQKKAYVIARRGAFFEFDLINRTRKLRGNLYQLEPALKNLDFYGSNAWDKYGRFYFLSFPKEGAPVKNTKLIAIDPKRFAVN